MKFSTKSNFIFNIILLSLLLIIINSDLILRSPKDLQSMFKGKKYIYKFIICVI